VEVIGEMRTRIILLAVATLAQIHSPASSSSNMSHTIVKWNGMNVHVVTSNLNSPNLRVAPVLARNGAGNSETFTSIIHRTQPTAAITGTFFCTHSLLPTGDIVIEGRRVHIGSVGMGVCFTPQNTVRFVPLKEGHRTGWAGYNAVICAGPTLVRNGYIHLAPRDEGFSDPGLFVKKQRTALGVTSDNKLLMVVAKSPIYLRTIAKIMRDLGAVDAVNLDGGSSAALYYDGRVLSRPGRKLTNLLAVYDSPYSYCAHRESFAPETILTAAETAGRTAHPLAADAIQAANLAKDILPLVDAQAYERIHLSQVAGADGDPSQFMSFGDREVYWKKEEPDGNLVRL
jgi:hypothetical protein